jgi:hypothetical protein
MPPNQRERKVCVTKYTVVVKGGRIIYDGESLSEANSKFELFMSQSNGSEELVTLFQDSEIVRTPKWKRFLPRPWPWRRYATNTEFQCFRVEPAVADWLPHSPVRAQLRHTVLQARISLRRWSGPFHAIWHPLARPVPLSVVVSLTLPSSALGPPILRVPPTVSSARHPPSLLVPCIVFPSFIDMVVHFGASYPTLQPG